MVRVALLALLLTAGAAAPANALTRTFFCFFDMDSAELSPRCQAVLQDFVGYWQRWARGEIRSWPDDKPAPAYTARVEVVSHADRDEAARGKAEVSRLRAEAVAAFLVRNGLPAELITTMPFGATRPLVPAAGAEPQNRRVELYAR